MYEYRAKPLRIVDGDTVQFSVDLGLNVHRVETLRLFGINTPETNSSNPSERQRGIAAKDYVSRILLGLPDPNVVEAIAKLAGEDKANEMASLIERFFAPVAMDVKVQTSRPYSTDKYGRWLGTIFYKTVTSDPANPWINLNESLVALGFAQPYFGGAR